MRRFLAHSSGLVAYFFIEGFIRIVIMFYHRTDFHFYGISNLPSDVWVIVILFSILINSWLITMLILSVINKNPLNNAILFASILLLWRIFEISNSYKVEPIWYFLTAIFLNIIGVYLAYQLFKKQYENISST